MSQRITVQETKHTPLWLWLAGPVLLLFTAVSVPVFHHVRWNNDSAVRWRPAGAALSFEMSGSAKAGRDYYIAPNGDDDGGGSSKKPWKSFERADRAVKPGDVVHVLPGTYSVVSVQTKGSGTAEARITWISDVRWGAKIVSSESGKWSDAWHNEGSYVDIRGFDVTGAGNNGIVNNGSHVRVVGNRVHDLPAPGPVGVGGSGIAHANPRASDNDTIANVVFNIGDFREPNPRVHGIYYSNRRGYVYNNLVYRNRSWGIHAGHNASELHICNNTVVGNGYGGIVLAPDFRDFGPGERASEQFVVANNIVYENGKSKGAQGYGISEYASEKSLSPRNFYLGNLVYRNGPSDWNLKITGGKGAQSLSADPRFVISADADAPDFRLRSDSPALHASAGDVTPVFDLEGGKRPPNKSDVGAYQSGTTSASWPWPLSRSTSE